ncbi:MAG: cellulose binding domain-containing protein [Micromonosporaceae bacterium]|nr:cellulose binding domain-containing protein [Micromonosporaceae bacterium]
MSGRIPRPRILVALALSLGLVAAIGILTLPAAKAATSGFVQRCGIHFCINGKTYYFAGANTYDVFTFGGSYGDTETQYMDKTRIDNHFTQLAADKVSVLRLWMFSHESWHGFEPSEGVYNDQQFALFDYVIESAKTHGVQLIPVFENYWEAYGGIDTRLKWEGLSGGHPGRAAFFDKTRCPGCFEQYKNYVSYALNRTNHYSGVKYKDDPTIFAWELMNEPRYQDQSTAENASGATLRAWVDEMGAFIKGIDSNHMLGTGLEGHESRYGFGGDEGNPFIGIHQSPYIDFTSAHPYTTEEWAGPMALDATRALIREWISDSHSVVGKPFFMGEFNTKNVDRSAWWSAMFSDFLAADGDGSAFWWYLDPANTASDNYSVKPGAAELSAFRTHSAAMIAKSGGTPTTASPSAPSSASASTSGISSGSPSPTPLGACSVTYRTDTWSTGFVANVTITNTGASAINDWTLRWRFPSTQQITSAWNATVTQSETSVTAVNVAWNDTIAANSSVSFGFQGTHGGINPTPPAFVLNGGTCTMG